MPFYGTWNSDPTIIQNDVFPQLKIIRTIAERANFGKAELDFHFPLKRFHNLIDPFSGQEKGRLKPIGGQILPELLTARENLARGTQ
jgi:hypothetical protein